MSALTPSLITRADIGQSLPCLARVAHAVCLMRIHTFRVSCSVVLQYSFTESEVTQDPEGRKADVVPTDQAIAALQADIEATLGEDHAVSSVIVDVGSDDLLGTREE
jgi:hypothetical protein